MTEEFKVKAKALVKESIILLLDLISKHEAITSKCTNATKNKMKEEAWKSISQEFSALTGDLRRPEQLRLKWENLKKAARKRSALIRQNNLKTGGGKAFIAPDEVLERVSSILGTTCSGLSVEFGGDGVEETVFPQAESQVPSQAVMEVIDFQPLPGLSQIIQSGSTAVDCDLEAGHGKAATFTPNKGLVKRRKLLEQIKTAQRDKDLGLAAYFQAKAEKVTLEKRKIQLENQKIDLENRKLELENKKLEMENFKLELEIKQLKEKFTE